MSLEEIKQLLAGKFGAEVVIKEETGGLQSALIIHPDKISDVCFELRDNEQTYFDQRCS